MKLFTLTLAVALSCGIGAEAAQIRKAAVRPDVRTVLKNLDNPVKIVVPSDYDDDFPIYEIPDGEESMMSRDCDSFEVEGYEAVHSKILGSITRFVTTDDAVYIANPISSYPVESYLKAVQTGDTLSIRGAQPIYLDYDWDTEETYMIYAVPMEIIVDENQQGTCVAAADMRYDLVLNADGVYESIDHDKLLGVCILSDALDDSEVIGNNYYWTGYGDRDVKISKVTSTLVEVPEGIQIQRWLWQDQYETALAKVILDGNDIYIAGMDRNLPEAWVKGTIEGDKAIFPSGQYLGPDYYIGYYSYFCGAEFEYETDPETGEDIRYSVLAESAMFDYSEDGPAIYTINGYVINSTEDRLFPLYGYDQVDVRCNNRDVNAAPAAPYDVVFEDYGWEKKVWVQIPNVDVDGNLLDEESLYYQILVNNEPIVFDPETYIDFYEATTLIPYNLDGYDVYVWGTDHTVYLYCDIDGTVGVRSVYINENGETLYSDIAYTEVDSIEKVGNDKQPVSEVWHDLYGRLINRPASGTIAIRTITYSDGSVDHRKVLTK